MLPSPTFTFTIPSIHDDTILDCRVYHPLKFLSCGATGETQWQKRGAIIAHPYAPLGGCLDDPIVDAVAIEILKQGFVIGTFNFRGAGSSKGRTSWTGKPELHDYISFTGFFIHYLHNLQPLTSRSPPGHSCTTSGNALTPIQSSYPVPVNPFDAVNFGITLILGGYSYGSLITAHLPTTDVILSRFTHTVKGTATAEIILRAAHLSQQWNQETQQTNEARRGRSLKVQDALRGSSHSITMGGEESDPGSRRMSRHSRRSLDGLRRSLDISRRKLNSKNHSSEEESELPKDERLPPVDITLPQTSYLLISPLLPPISMFATMFSNVGLNDTGNKSPPNKGGKDGVLTGKILTNYTTLAIYGDKDFFTSQRKLRKWAEHLAGVPESRFQFKEIRGAGHFWHEDGVEEQMRVTVREWVEDIVHSKGSG